MRMWAALSIIVFGYMGIAQAEGDAQKGKVKAKTGVSRVLKTLDWKASSAAVLADAKAALSAQYAKKISRHTDALTVDRILREKRAAFAKVKQSHIQFGAGRSGYEASVVADEFRANAGESMIRINDAQAQRYYFFQNDRLWKIVVVYDASITQKVDFDKFIKQIQGKYGPPAKMDWHTPAGGTRTLRGVVWTDKITHLTVEDRREFFGTYLMRFVDKIDGLPLEERRRKGGKPSAAPGGDFTDGMMADIMGDSNGSSSANVVDELTGSTHAVDLTTGRPQDETTALDRTDIEAEPKRRHKRKARRKSKDKSKAKPAPTTSDEPYIIY